MVEAWQEVAPEQRTSELIDLIEKQKDKDKEHSIREDEMDKKSMEKMIELSDLISVLAKHINNLESRVEKLENSK
jgi:hypothetical protein